MNNKIELEYNFQQVDDNVIIVVSAWDNGEFLKSINLFFEIENGKLVDYTEGLNKKILKEIKKEI